MNSIAITAASGYIGQRLIFRYRYDGYAALDAFLRSHNLLF